MISATIAFGVWPYGPSARWRDRILSSAENEQDSLVEWRDQSFIAISGERQRAFSLSNNEVAS